MRSKYIRKELKIKSVQNEFTICKTKWNELTEQMPDGGKSK